MAGLFQVLWGQPNGTFKKAQILEGTDSEPLIIPTKTRDEITLTICTRPFAVDWTGNGNLDLIVGNFKGTFYRFIGEGKGRFNPKPEPITTQDGAPLQIEGAHGDPFVVDWDGDGDLDLLSGSSMGGVQWAENTAGRGKKPTLAAFKMIVEPGPEILSGRLLSEGDLKGPTTSTRVWAADVNKDGKLDLLVGDSVTLISTAKGVSPAEFTKRYEEWDKAFQAAQGAEFPRELYEKRKEFMTEERTGYVWAYLRK